MPLSDINRALSDVALFIVDNEVVLEIGGADAQRYLHGRLTQDIKILIPGTGAHSLLLTPQGKIQAKLRILRTPNSYFLIPETSITDVNNFLQALLQFKVADDVSVTGNPGAYRVLSLQGPRVGDALCDLGVKLPDDPRELCSLQTSFLDSELLVVRTSRSPAGGYDLLIPAQNCEHLNQGISQSLHLALGTKETLDALRILTATPRFGVDIDHTTLAPDIPLSTLVSFNKGCYVGQEVVEMAASRGRPNRELVQLRSDLNQSIPSDTPIFSVDGSKAIGTITSSVYLPNNGGLFALGFIKTNVLHNGRCKVLDRQLTVHNLPIPT